MTTPSLSETENAQPQYLFPDSGPAKRATLHAVRLYGRLLPQTFAPIPPPGDSNTRLLIQIPSGMGNALMATPMIAAARSLYPEATIDVLSTPGAIQLLKHDPAVSSVIADAVEESGRYARDLRVIRKIRAARYDAALACANSHLIRGAARLVLGRIPRRIIHHYDFKPDDNFLSAFNAVVERHADRHFVEANTDLLTKLSGQRVDPGPFRLHLPDAAHADAEQILTEAGWRRDHPTVIVGPGSAGKMSYKRWPLDRNVELVRRLRSEYPGWNTVVLIGPDEAGDYPIWQEQGAPAGAILLFKLPLLAATATLAKADVCVANDNYFMHVCAAFQRPVVALFGPTDPRNTGPWKSPARVIVPDGRHEPYYEVPYAPHPGRFPDYMAQISVDTVLEAVVTSIESPQSVLAERDS